MEFIEYSVDGAVALIRLNRPPVNALSMELAVELREAFVRAGDPQIRAAVITGQPHFAAGADIKGFQEHYETESGEPFEIPLREAIGDLAALEKPTIAAIFGYALGGGLELSLGADFRYLAEDAQVGQPEIKLGLIPGAGGTQRLARVVGSAKARDIVYSGRFVAAPEAAAIGLADKVAPADELLDLALQDAAEWAKGPTMAIAAAKRALRDGIALPIDEAIDLERREFDGIFWSADARAGVAAFIAKEDPDFSGS